MTDPPSQRLEFSMGKGRRRFTAETADDIVRLTIRAGDHQHEWYYLDCQEAEQVHALLAVFLGARERCLAAACIQPPLRAAFCERHNGFIPSEVVDGVAYAASEGKQVSLTPGECALEIQRLQAELREYEHSFDLRWRADMRAIKRWQAEAPSRDSIWPDHADMVVWLLNKLPACAEDTSKHLQP